MRKKINTCIKITFIYADISRHCYLGRKRKINCWVTQCIVLVFVFLFTVGNTIKIIIGVLSLTFSHNIYQSRWRFVVDHVEAGKTVDFGTAIAKSIMTRVSMIHRRTTVVTSIVVVVTLRRNIEKETVHANRRQAIAEISIHQ